MKSFLLPAARQRQATVVLLLVWSLGYGCYLGVHQLVVYWNTGGR